MAREAAGFQSASDAARRFGWAIPTYLGHENGTRNIPREKILTYAKAFKVPAEWLLVGGPLQNVTKKGHIVVRGAVMHDRQVKIKSSDEDAELFEEIEFPFFVSDGCAAFVVRTKELSPAYDEGDLLICNLNQDVKESQGVDCVVELQSGDLSFRRVNIAAGGIVVLEGSPLTPLINPNIVAVHPVMWVRKNFTKI